jgi:hypothetical protein
MEGFGGGSGKMGLWRRDEEAGAIAFVKLVIERVKEAGLVA